VAILVLQHIACEPPGVYEDVLADRGLELRRVELDEGDTLPSWREFDAIVAMGGPMSVNDDLPWLAGEKLLIAEAVRAGIPFWGVCLGVQLLASALGARVYAGEEPEVGVLPVSLTDEGLRDPVFGALPSTFPSLQWHGDTFDLPEGAVRLAGSPAYPNQAFRSERAYGVQFHLEVSPAMAREWADVPEYAQSLEQTIGTEELLGAVDAEAQRMLSNGRALFERWRQRAAYDRRQRAHGGVAECRRRCGAVSRSGGSGTSGIRTGSTPTARRSFGRR
jgi:GMP synthase (glutamine-hydrolysing)